MHVQKNKWKGHNRTATCWASYCVNDNKEVDVKLPQIMKCIELYYTNLMLVSNMKIQARKGLILHNITNGITTLRNIHF